MTRNRKRLFKRLNAVLTPPTKYSVKIVECFSSVWYVIALLLLGAILVLLWPFCRFDNEKHQTKPVLPCPFFAIGVSACPMWHPVASNEALDPLYRPMRAVLYRRIAMAIKTARKVGVFIHCCVVYCHHGFRGSNTEQVVAWWQRLVASDMALDIHHWTMLYESL